MKAITFYQPWASLIAWEEKRFETRGWATSYRGPLAIHASLRFATEEKTFCWLPPFAEALRRRDMTPSELPLGCVLCIVDLVWRILKKPIAIRGHQGLWDWPVMMDKLVFEELHAEVPSA